MMKQEFERLAGYEVSDKDYYEILEPMYAAINCTKQEFVGMINKKRFALKSPQAIVKEMRSTAAEIKKNCTHYIDSANKEKLEALIAEYVTRKGLDGLVNTMIVHGERMYCYFPNRIEIYFIGSYKTYETIDLF